MSNYTTLKQGQPDQLLALAKHTPKPRPRRSRSPSTYTVSPQTPSDTKSAQTLPPSGGAHPQQTTHKRHSHTETKRLSGYSSRQDTLTHTTSHLSSPLNYGYSSGRKHRVQSPHRHRTESVTQAPCQQADRSFRCCLEASPRRINATPPHRPPHRQPPSPPAPRRRCTRCSTTTRYLSSPSSRP